MTLVTIRRLEGGKFLITYCRSLDGERVVAITPVDYWRRGKRKREVGGIPPKPFRKLPDAKVRKPRKLPPDEVG